MLGEVVKEMRRKKQMTLQNLSEASGLSIALLSQLENDQANPTLSTLRKVAEALGMSVFALLAQEEIGHGSVKVERNISRRAFTAPRFNTVFEILSLSYSSNRMQALMADIEPGMSTCDEPMAHGTWNDEEWAIVLEGEVQLEVGRERHHMQVGDCAHFHPVLPHRFTNIGRTKASIVSVISPPSY
ncbi:MAG: helix-turn-helix domain-containing protein [Bacillota bacterium]